MTNRNRTFDVKTGRILLEDIEYSQQTVERLLLHKRGRTGERVGVDDSSWSSECHDDGSSSDTSSVDSSEVDILDHSSEYGEDGWWDSGDQSTLLMNQSASVTEQDSKANTVEHPHSQSDKQFNEKDVGVSSVERKLQSVSPVAPDNIDSADRDKAKTVFSRSSPQVDSVVSHEEDGLSPFPPSTMGDIASPSSAVGSDTDGTRSSRSHRVSSNRLTAVPEKDIVSGKRRLKINVSSYDSLQSFVDAHVPFYRLR